MREPLMAKISVFGLGKLGCPLAAVLASKGHDVIGVDLHEPFVAAVNQQRSPLYEPGLDELLRQTAGRLRATTDGHEAALQTDASFIIVPTPSDEQGAFSIRFVLPVLEVIGSALRKKAGYHLVVITSTVMPGATGGEIQATLQRASGRTLGPTLGLCYNPEFVALGSVIRDTLQAELLLIGQSDDEAGRRLETIFDTVHAGGPHPAVRRMNFVNAELTKIAVNTFVTTKISYANMLARICEKLPGASVDAVTHALAADSRIGGKYLKGAVNYGGPCFPRDNVAFVTMARRIGADATLAEATHRVNQLQVEQLADLTCRHLPPGGRAAVLGLAYKPKTDVCEVSTGVLLAAELARRGVRVCTYDPAAIPAARKTLPATVQFTESMDACVRQGDVVVVTVAWDEFGQLTREHFTARAQPAIVIDCWRTLDPAAFAPQAKVIALGCGEG
jgi:UDPglucose 6-dehydrogenase